MLYKRKNTLNYLIFLAPLVLVIALLGITKTKQWYREGLFDVIDTITTYDIGISGLPGFFGRSNFEDFSKDSWAQIFHVMATELPSRTAEIFNGTNNSKTEPTIPRLEIDLNFRQYSELLASRGRAIRDGLLSDRDWIRFSGRYEGKIVRGKLRLKGDFNDHWRSTRRMSLMIVLDSRSPSVYGFRKFSIHKPEARQFPYDQIFQTVAQDLGILAQLHGLVRVNMNGQSWGIMDIEELPSPTAIEKQGRKSSLVLKFGNESEFFRLNGQYGRQNWLVHKLPEPTLVGNTKLLDTGVTRRQFSEMVSAIESETYTDYIDTELYALHALWALAWGSLHTLEPNNSKSYFNPYTFKLEPYSGDQSKFRAANIDYYRSVLVPEVNRYQYPRHPPASRSAAVQTLPETGHCCCRGV